MDKRTLTEQYRATLNANGWETDPNQLLAVAALERVATDLQAAGSRRWRPWRRPPPVRGLYLWGSVGRGKTFLMDLFVATAPAGQAVRKHFHRFMSEVHDALGLLEHQRDPLRAVARQLADEAPVLCLDEMHVNDIGDAMILGRLFEHLFEYGVVLVTTSNIPPDGLYKDGLQRARFLPAIALLKQRCEVLHLGGALDYRLQVLSTGETFHVFDAEDPQGTGWAKARFDALAREQALQDREILVLGRLIAARGRAPGIAWFDFDTLCRTARSQLDYISLSKRLHTVILSGVPVLDAADDDAVRRLISLVDEFYDRHVNLLLSAAAPIRELYAGTRLAFEFERTVSRLNEMQSSEYHALAHRP